MSFGTAPGGTTVGSAQYTVSLDTQAMLQGLQQLQQATQQSSQQIVAALGQISGEEKQIEASSASMAAEVTRDMTAMDAAMEKMAGATSIATEKLGELKNIALEFVGIQAVSDVVEKLSEQFKDAVKETQTFGFEVQQLQRVMGVSTQTASEFAAVFDRYDIGGQQAIRSFTQLSRAMEGLDDSTTKVSGSTLSGQAALKNLGIQLEDTAGNTKGLDQVFLEVIDALKAQGEGFETNAEAQALFSRSYQDLLPIIQLGSEGFKQLAEEAKGYGLVLTTANADQVNKFIESQRDLNDAMAGLKLTVGTELAPVLTDLFNYLANWSKDNKDNVVQAMKDIGAGASTMGTAFSIMTQPLKDDLAAIKELAEDIKAIQALNPGQLFGEMGRVAQASDAGGNVDLQKLQQLDAESRGANSIASGVPAPPPEIALSTGDEASKKAAANNTALEKTIEGNLKDRASAVKDEAQAEIDSLHQQEQAAQQSYQNQLHAYQIQKDEQTRANDAWHKGALASLQEEEDATKKSYAAQIAAATDAKDKQTKAAAEEHTAALAQIASEVTAAQDASKQRVSDLTEQRDADFANIETIKQSQLDAIAAQQQAVQDARLQQDRALQDARQQEDRDAQTAHQAELDRLKTEHDAAVQRFTDERAEIEKTKQAALEAIQAETDARSQAHDATLQHLKDEQTAAQAQHDQIQQNLQDQQTAAQTAHDQRVRQLQDEQTAEQNASQAAQDALKAQQDAETQQHQQRLADIDAEAKAQQTALQQQLAGLNQQQATDTFAAQQAKLQAAVTQAQTGVQIAQEIAQNTGDPNTVLAAQKALADAQAALDKANADRAVQLQKDTIQQEEQALQDQTDVKKQAENDQYQAEKDRITKEIADEQARLKAVKDSIAQQITAANDQLAVVKNDLAQQQQANDAALKARLAGIQQETEAENNAFKAFQTSEANKRKEAETTATTALANVQGESDAEGKAYTTSTKAVDTRYADEQQRVADTRKAQDRAITDNRTQEDRDVATHKQAVQDQAAHDHDQIDNLYNNPKTGLIQIEKNALAETLADLATRKTNADTTYQDEQTQIAATFTDKDTGLIPKLQAALKEQTDDYTLRRGDVNTTYQNEKDRIFETFDKDTGDPATSGLIPALGYAYTATKDNLAKQVTEWQAWSKDVNTEINATIKNLQGLIDKVNELNNIGKNPVREGPQPVEGEAQGNEPGQTSDQGGQKGPSYGGAPISLEQFSTDKDSILARFGVATEKAACGPIAAEALARLYGHPVDMGEIIQYAKDHGLWTTEGMGGGPSWVALAEHFGVDIADTSEGAAQAALARGIPIVVNTKDHYWVAQGYDPATQTYDMGFSGQSAYGQRYVTRRQIEALSGPIQDFYEPTGGVPSGGAASVQSGATTISIPSLGINFDVSTPVVDRVQVGAAKVPSAPDQIAWRDFMANFAPPDLRTNLNFLKVVEAGALAESGLDPSRVQQGLPRSLAAKGLFQFDPGGMGAGKPDSLLFDPDYEASQIIPLYASTYQRLLPSSGGMSPAEFASLVAATVERPLGYDDPSSTARRNYAAAFNSIQAYAAGGIIPEPTALLRLRDLQPYAVAGEVGPERVAPLGGPGAASRQMVDQTVHNYYGVAPESIVRDMMNAQRRERLLRGR